MYHLPLSKSIYSQNHQMRFIKKNDRHIKDHVAFNSNKGVHLRFSFVLEDAPIPPTFDGLFAQTLLYST